MNRQHVTLAIVGSVALALIAATHLPVTTTANAQNMTGRGVGGQNQTEMTSTTATTFTAQKTAMSTVDSLPGHEHHQAAVVLPARTDGKIWVGTISWTSSKPVELRLLYDYNSTIVPDATHGKPSIASFGKGEVAISLIKPLNSGAEAASFNSGSMNFAAKQVAFHTIDGTPFTVTYAVDANAR